MGPILEKSSNPFRTLVLGLLVSCPYTTCTEGCTLGKLHNGLSIDEKHEYTQRLSDEEIKKHFGAIRTLLRKKIV